MKKKFSCAALAALLAALSCTVGASAANVNTEASTGAKGTVKFVNENWDSNDRVNFYIWAKDADGNIKHAYNGGWEDNNNWGLMRTRGNPVEGEEHTWESYEFELLDGYDTYVTFLDQTTGEYTYACLLKKSALGATARATGEYVEDPFNINTSNILADFDGVSDCGPRLMISSKGIVLGQYIGDVENPAHTVAEFIYDNIGRTLLSGEEVVTADKMAEAVSRFGTTKEAVWADFQTIEGHEDKDEDVKKLLGIGNDTKMGDLDGDGALTASDALMILRISVGMSKAGDEIAKISDLDGDGKITSADALKVLRISVKLYD